MSNEQLKNYLAAKKDPNALREEMASTAGAYKDQLQSMDHMAVKAQKYATLYSELGSVIDDGDLNAPPEVVAALGPARAMRTKFQGTVDVHSRNAAGLEDQYDLMNARLMELDPEAEKMSLHEAGAFGMDKDHPIAR